MSAKLLVVEDAPIIREPLVRLLRAEGFEVHAANHGGEALERIREHAIDLILLDVLMPRMTGIEFIQTMRSDSRFTSMPIIGLTGTFDSLQLEQLRKHGVETILAKGKFEIDQLIEVIRTSLGER